MFPAPSDFSPVSLRQPGRSPASIGEPASWPRPSRWATLRRTSRRVLRSLARLERQVVGVAMLAMVLVLEWRLARMARA